jgi:hypothetical protein
MLRAFSRLSDFNLRPLHTTLHLGELNLQLAHLMFLCFDQLVFCLLVCEQLGFHLSELVKFLVGRAHLLDHVLHLTGVLELTLQ